MAINMIKVIIFCVFYSAKFCCNAISLIYNLHKIIDPDPKKQGVISLIENLFFINRVI